MKTHILVLTNTEQSAASSISPEYTICTDYKHEKYPLSFSLYKYALQYQYVHYLKGIKIYGHNILPLGINFPGMLLISKSYLPRYSLRKNSSGLT